MSIQLCCTLEDNIHQLLRYYVRDRAGRIALRFSGNIGVTLVLFEAGQVVPRHEVEHQPTGVYSMTSSGLRCRREKSSTAVGLDAIKMAA